MLTVAQTTQSVKVKNVCLFVCLFFRLCLCVCVWVWVGGWVGRSVGACGLLLSLKACPADAGNRRVPVADAVKASAKARERWSRWIGQAVATSS